jgi:cation diffusion facilitator family transporter
VDAASGRQTVILTLFPVLHDRSKGRRLRHNASAQSLYRAASQAALLGLVVNLALGVAKLVGGIAGDSFALISDAVNSLGDTLTSAVVLGALWYAQRPADEEHPYGHTRAEAVAASNVALVIIISALYVGWEAIGRMTLRHEPPPVWTLWIAAANVLIKEWLYRYKLRVGKQTRSAAVIANAWDHRGDALCSLAVCVGLGLVRWAGPGYAWADEAAALVVVVAIVWSGVRLFRTSTSELLDPQADPELVEQIRAQAASIEGVRAVEKLWVRKTGLEYLADIHIQVDAKLSVTEGHRIGHLVKNRLVQEFASLRDVLVHLEPFPHRHAEA